MHPDKLIQTFIELVHVDSETRYEAAICADLTARLTVLGFEVTCDNKGPSIGHQAGNLFATLAATPGAEHVPTVLFTCHMDTVAPGVSIRPQIDPDGYIRSDGTTILGSDDKAGIAAFVHAIEELRASGEPHGRVVFVVTVAEESGLLGSGLLQTGDVQADYGYALDSNGAVGEIVVAAPSTTKIRAVFHGKKAHAGVNPEDGVSAIAMAGAAIAGMRLGRIDASTTANLGRIEGGGATNVVCDEVELTAEARSLDEAALAAQVAHMCSTMERAAADLGGRVMITTQSMYPAYNIASASRVVQVASRAVAAIGRTATCVTSGGGSDANHFNRIGIPTVNLAIGYEHIHTTSEQMPIVELVKTAELVAAIMRQTYREGEF